MQTITITGYLSRGAESSETQKGDKVTRWNVPVKQGFGDSEQTNWFRVSIWGKRADFAARARKGEFVTVTGDLTIGDYQGKPQYEIRANDFQSVRTAPREGADSDTGAQRRSNDGLGSDEGIHQGSGNPGGLDDFLDDDVPF